MKLWKKLLLALGVLLALSLVWGINWLRHNAGLRAHVSDAELIRILDQHEEQFQLLISMFREDGANVIHPTWIDPDDVVSSERWEEYKVIFRRLGLDAGVRAWRQPCGECLSFISTVQGFVTHGSSKGYLYQPGDVSPLYESLDPMSEDPRRYGTGYRKIDDDWYLRFDRD